jgi:cilia- and flagella-associated protein 57
MTSQISDMDVELENYHKATSDLDLSIIELKLKLKAAEKEVEKEKKMVNSGIAFVRRFKIDLAETVQHIQDSRQLKVSSINKDIS